MNWLRSYFTYASVERKGLAGLSVIALILLIIYATMQYFIPQPEIQTDTQLLAAFNKYKQEHTTAEDGGDEDPNTIFRAGELFPFDPNNLDSTGFIRLGLRSRTTHLLLNWRRKGKIFYRKEDLKSLYTLKEEEYKRLEPYISIPPSSAFEHHYTPFAKQAPLPDHIDLNTTDSATIVRLNGIGPVLAHKIIERRKALGGFVKHEQLNEVYKFPDTTFKMLRERLVINIQTVKKFGLNSANIEELKSHPYIGEKMAKNIVLFREGLKRYDNVDQLRQVPLMNEEIYRKIAPYFTPD